MTWTPDPIWPVLILAAISIGDAVLCLRPVEFIARCLRDVGFPQQYWSLLPVLKFAAAAGLIAGIWIPFLGAMTTGCLVLYFVAAIGAHVRSRDFGRNLFLNATGMLTTCVAVLVVSFLA